MRENKWNGEIVPINSLYEIVINCDDQIKLKTDKFLTLLTFS